MQLCSRCKKRFAVVFMTRFENGVQKSEGLCLQCAKDLGIQPVDDIIKNMGISEEQLENMEDEMQNLGESIDELTITDDVSTPDDESNDGTAPAIDLFKIFGQSGNHGDKNASKDKKKNEKEKKPDESKSYLNNYCINLTKKARDGIVDRVIGRERELDRMMQILNRRQKNNPCLIGEPGVGKTALAEALAQRIVSGNVPYKMKNKEVFLLDLTALVAGTQFRGQFEGRMKGLISEVKEKGNIILVIDEVHNLVGAGDAEGSMNAANILKPSLSRGEIQVIGATTLTEYRKYIEKDSALERRFQPVIINEPSVDETVEILKGIKNYYEKFHGITITDETIKRAVILSERYITDRFLPDKAIDLLDEAASHLAINSPVIGDIDYRRDVLEKTTAERTTLEGTEPDEDSDPTQRYARIATLKSDELRLTNEITELEKEREQIVLTSAHLADVIEIWTGIPAGTITEEEFARVDKLSDRLKKHIIGQDKAIESVCRAIKRNRAGVSYKRKPVSFIFAGPTGVGKTELVKQLASDLFDSPEALIRLDMSEFMEKHAVSRIIGSPPGYVGYDEAGQLTEKIRRKPYSVILFDEIEKAHPDVMNILLQILDDGEITDSHGKKVNFENTVIIMTTNAGSNYVTSPAGFGKTADENSESRTMKALSDFLRPEFLNRVDEIITFSSLTEENFAGIAKIMLGQLSAALAEHGVSLEYTAEVAQFVAKRSYSQKYGARNMRRFIESNIEDKIAERIIGSYETKITHISLSVSENGEEIEVTAE